MRSIVPDPRALALGDQYYHKGGRLKVHGDALSQRSRNVLIERSRNVLLTDSGLDARGQVRDGPEGTGSA
ncbi:MAG TPA: hypothetical protein VEX68_27735, partial [Bryobacteraceae bacterium]|nr:hypothetical protein [Bryobacteraceae bacterium]